MIRAALTAAAPIVTESPPVSGRWGLSGPCDSPGPPGPPGWLGVDVGGVVGGFVGGVVGGFVGGVVGGFVGGVVGGFVRVYDRSLDGGVV
ncbi:hypothetical protein ACFUMI_16795, partial [Streptomyces sp. NPDC057273]|uniref:hypothetical protein n=1 Tax=Streptomyces sp. NPDC057273 TaxID=3346080 RepID=UPI0036414B2B